MGHPEQLSRLQAELQHWPEVHYRVEQGGSHPRLVLRYQQTTRKLPFSSTPVAGRGILNKVAELRRLLRNIGAHRD